jgi:hypothetical protein
MDGFAVLVLVTIHFLLDRLVTDSTVEDFRNRFHGTTSRESFLTLSGVKTPEQGAFSPCPVSRHPHCPISRSNFFSLAFSASSLDSCPVPAGANRRAGNSVVDLRQLLCSRHRMLQARTAKRSLTHPGVGPTTAVAFLMVPPIPIPGMHSGVEAAQKDGYAGN